MLLCWVDAATVLQRRELQGGWAAGDAEQRSHDACNDQPTGRVAKECPATWKPLVVPSV
jgi:hypothetical protein